MLHSKHSSGALQNAALSHTRACCAVWQQLSSILRSTKHWFVAANIVALLPASSAQSSPDTGGLALIPQIQPLSLLLS